MERPLIYRCSELNSALRQGEILTNVIQYKPITTDQESEINFEKIVHPYSILVTQDCDLDWDYKARLNDSQLTAKNILNPKLLNSIVFCEVDTAQNIRDISDKNAMNSKEWDLVKSHRHERFYFFEKIPSEYESQQQGLPELTADFKKVFAIDAEFLYNQIKLGVTQRRTILVSPYLEHFSQRYHNFQGRVALPSQYESEKQNS